MTGWYLYLVYLVLLNQAEEYDKRFCYYYYYSPHLKVNFYFISQKTI